MYDFRHVRIPSALLTEAEKVAALLQAQPDAPKLGNGKGATTATIHLALERGLASLRSEIATPPKPKRRKAKP